MYDKDKIEELISIYALGALEGEELEYIEKLLTSDQEARELLEKYQNVASHISYSSKGRMPDPSLRKKVLSETLGPKKTPVVDESPPFWKRFQLVGFSFGALAAALLVLFILPKEQSVYETLGDNGVVISELKQKISEQEELITSLQTTIEEKDLQYGELSEHYARLDEISEFLEEPGVHVIQLANLHTDKDAGGGVLLDKAKNEALLYCLDLEHPPEGKTYQWWVEVDDTHKSVSVFKVDNNGSGIVKVDSFSDLGNVQRYLVTVEPIGSSPDKPSEKLIFAGDHRGSSL